MSQYSSVYFGIKLSHNSQMAKNNPTPYPLRMPDELRDKIEVASKASGRSLNAEIVHWLQIAIEPGLSVGEPESDYDSPSLQQRVSALEKKIEELLG